MLVGRIGVAKDAIAINGSCRDGDRERRSGRDAGRQKYVLDVISRIGRAARGGQAA